MVGKVNGKNRDGDKERDRKDNRWERKSLILVEVLCIAIFVPTALLPYRTGCHKPPRATVGLLSWTLETTAANWGSASNKLVTFYWALLFLTTTALVFSQTHGVFSFRCCAWFYSTDVVIVVVCLINLVAMKEVWCHIPISVFLLPIAVKFSRLRFSKALWVRLSWS